MIPRHLEVVYCDDLRSEVGNKMSAMGIYAGELIVDKLPAVLPKICVMATAVTPSADPFKKLIFKVSLNDTVLLESSDFGDSSKLGPVDSDSEEPKYTIARAIFQLNGLSVEPGQRLRISAETETEIMRASALRILEQRRAKDSEVVDQ